MSLQAGIESKKNLRVRFGKYGGLKLEYFWVVKSKKAKSFICGLFFYRPFSDFFFQNLVWQKRSKGQKVLEKNSKTFCPFQLFHQIPIFFVQTRPNSFVFDPNIKTIKWGCFSAQFFPLITILKSKMIQDEKQKSCTIRVDLSFHQIGHKWPLLGMFTHDILKYSYEIVVRVIFCNFGTFNFFRPNSSKLVQTGLLLNQK